MGSSDSKIFARIGEVPPHTIKRGVFVPYVRHFYGVLGRGEPEAVPRCFGIGRLRRELDVCVADLDRAVLVDVARA